MLFQNNIQENGYCFTGGYGGTLSPSCIQLVTLFYRAIDSPKTGETIDMSIVYSLQDRFGSKFPKFMMKFDRPYYQSKSILEELYLNAKRIHLKRTDHCKNNRILSVLQTRRQSSTTVISRSQSDHDQSLYSFQSLRSLLDSVIRFVIWR